MSGESHEGSDLDLVLRSPPFKPLGSEYLDLIEALDESNIPILIQVSDWATLPKTFHQEVKRDYITLVESGEARIHTDGITLSA